MLKELLAASVDLYIDQGDTYYKTFTIKDNAGTLVDLTGTSLAVDVRRYANTRKTYPIESEIVTPAAGLIALSMTPSQSMLYTNDRYVYQVKIIDGSDVIKIMTGQILVTAGASSLNTDLPLAGNSGNTIV